MESQEPETLTTIATTRTMIVTTAVTSRPSVSVCYTQSRNGKLSTETQNDNASDTPVFAVVPEPVAVITFQKEFTEAVHTIQSGKTTTERETASATTVRTTTEHSGATETTSLLENSFVICVTQQQHQESVRASTNAVPTTSSSDRNRQTRRATYGPVITSGYLNATWEFQRAAFEAVNLPPPNNDVLDLTLVRTPPNDDIFDVVRPIVECDICKRQLKPIFFHLKNGESFMLDTIIEGFHEVRPCKIKNNLELAHCDCMKQARTTDDGGNYFFSMHKKYLPILQWRPTEKFFEAMAIMIFMFIIPVPTISMMLYLTFEWSKNYIALQMVLLIMTLMIIVVFILITENMRRKIRLSWEQWLDSNREIKLIIWKPSKNKYFDQSSV